jgi:hypothetical protein
MEENKISDFIRKYRSRIFLGFLAAIALAFWSGKLLQSKRANTQHDFFIAQHIFERFQKGEHLPPTSLETVQSILERHPELHSKYDLMLALALFSQCKTSEALPYARSLIGQRERELPSFYKDYAQTTLLITEGNYVDAFAAALCLEGKLKDPLQYQTLDAMNTLRLLSLAHQLGDLPHEKTYWTKLTHHPSYATLVPLFQAGDLSLSHYFLQK